MTNGVSRREIGQYPLSIPTSLLMESLTNIHEEIKHPDPPLRHYQLLLINVKTLFRNLVNSLPTEQKLLANPEEIAEAMTAEMNYIVNLAKQYNPGITVSFYLSDYMGLDKKYKQAQLRGDSTERQLYYTQLMISSLTVLFKSPLLQHKIQVYRNVITDHFPFTSLIMTHYAYDLLSSKQFTSLTLAESHTGKLKSKGEFYTKYENGKNLVRIPFNEGFIQLFGDSEIFKPLNIKIRQMVMELAEQCGWTQLTSRDKVLHDLDKLKDRFAADQVKSLFRS